MKLLTGKKLIERVKELNIATSGADNEYAKNGYDEYELQRRVIEAERSKREGMLWLVALISAIASVISAIAAWAAIYR